MLLLPLIKRRLFGQVVGVHRWPAALVACLFSSSSSSFTTCTAVWSGLQHWPQRPLTLFKVASTATSLASSSRGTQRVIYESPADWSYGPNEAITHQLQQKKTFSFALCLASLGQNAPIEQQFHTHKEKTRRPEPLTSRILDSCSLLFAVVGP